MTDPVRERILREATRLFSAQGYGSTSIREVARTAEVTNPTIYYHFGSKEGLYLAAIQVHSDQLLDGLRELVAGEGPVIERLRGVIQLYVDGTHADPDGARLVVNAYPRPGSKEPQVDMMATHLEAARLLGELVSRGQAEGVIRADVDPVDAVLALTGSIVIRCQGILKGYDTPADISDRILAVFLHGVGAR